MKRLVIEIPADVIIKGEYDETIESAQLEEGDFKVIMKLAKHASLYIEFGAPHSNQELRDMGIAECFAIDIRQYNVRIEES